VVKSSFFISFFSQLSQKKKKKGCPWKTESEARLHIRALAQVVERLSPDILIMEEVEDCYVVKELNKLIPKLGYAPYVLRGTDTATGQNVGLLTRVDPVEDLKRTTNRVEYPISGNKCGYSGSNGDYGVSKHFYTRLHLSGVNKNIFLVAGHFLAFPDRTDR